MIDLNAYLIFDESKNCLYFLSSLSVCIMNDNLSFLRNIFIFNSVYITKTILYRIILDVIKND